MARRDLVFGKLWVVLLTAVLSPLLIRPWATPGNFGDIYAYHYPLRHLVTSTLEAGRLPLWNPYIFGGTPLAANPQAVLFYPGSVLHYFFPLAFAFTLDAALHLMLAWLGAFLLLRKRRLDPAGAFALAVAYALSPFLVCRIAQGVPTLLAALAWVPWVWLAAGAGSALLLGAVTAVQILSGHPQFCLLNLIGLGLWTLASARWTAAKTGTGRAVPAERTGGLAASQGHAKNPVPWPGRAGLAAWLQRAPGLAARLGPAPRALLVLAAGSCLALALAACQVLPTLEFLGRSVRGRWTAAFSIGYSFEPAFLLTFLCPGAFGNPLKEGFSRQPSEFFELLRGYIGLIPLLLGLAGIVRRKALLVLAGAGLFFALGANNPLYSSLQRGLGLDFLRVPSRFMLLALWALWLGAAAGWRSWLAGRPAFARGGLVLLIAADLALWSAGWIYPQDPKNFLRSDHGLMALLRSSGQRVATSPDITAPNKSMLYRVPNATGYEAFYLAAIAYHTAASERGPAADGSRTYIRKWNTPEMSRLAVRYYVASSLVSAATPDTATAPAAAATARTVTPAAATTPPAAHARTRAPMTALAPPAAATAAAQADTTACPIAAAALAPIATPRSVLEPSLLVYRRDSTYVYENPAAGRLVQGAPDWLIEAPERVLAFLEREGAVTLSQADYPGWKAWVNGAPVPVRSERGMFPSVRPPFPVRNLLGLSPPLAAGRDASPAWTVAFRFMPGRWLLGVGVSILSLAAAAILILRRLS